MMAFQSSWLLMAQTNDKAKSKSTPPDTVAIPLKIRVAIDIADPVIYALDRENKTFEGFLSADLNEKRSVYLNGGYSTCSISQNGYRYLAKGIFFKAGIDFNILKPQTAMGKFWGGIGFHYGVSPFTDQIPLLSQDNYWGSSSMSVPTKSHWGHYLEISPGFRAELFSGFAIGWSVSLRRLICWSGQRPKPDFYTRLWNQLKHVQHRVELLPDMEYSIQKNKRGHQEA